jgi:hypothetical protein
MLINVTLPIYFIKLFLFKNNFKIKLLAVHSVFKFHLETNLFFENSDF